MRRAEKQFAVIGLGRFGLAVCQELTDSGAQVLKCWLSTLMKNASS